MLYLLMRSMVRISLHFYQKRIVWEGVENVPQDKPVLFAITHSNSFLDALPIASAFNRPVYCLARGDAFRKPLANKILRHFRVLPIFRQSDNTEGYISKNEKTFEECQELLRQNQWILIFPEAFCTHQTSVQPLKKGFINMAQRAWAEGIDVQVVPVSITYDSFSKWGKKCDIIFNKPIQSSDIQGSTIEQAAQLKDITYSRLSENFPSPLQFKGQNVLWGRFGQLLYYAGWTLQFPVYFLSQYLGKTKTQGTVFYDSAVIGLVCVFLIVYYLLALVLFLIF
jgi:1-acyl-sn-glycerol-3-phosphate acyltransferase